MLSPYRKDWTPAKVFTETKTVQEAIAAMPPLVRDPVHEADRQWSLLEQSIEFGRPKYTFADRASLLGAGLVALSFGWGVAEAVKVLWRLLWS